MNIEHFQSHSRFYDDINFPYGLDRSGDFTKKQAEILTNCGQTLLSLELGHSQPANQAQSEFLDAMTGKKDCENDIEKTWMTYKTVVAGKGRKFSFNTLASEFGMQIDTDSGDSDD